LYQWNAKVTYSMISVKEIMTSIACADTLNSFNGDSMNGKIDDLVNKAINSESPGCCECCQLLV